MKPNHAGKTVSPLKLLRILWRRKWYVLLPALVLTPAVWYSATQMPRKFRAQALLGTTPEIPGRTSLKLETDVRATINAQEELRAIRETLLSRPVLESVIDEFRLYDVAPNGYSDETIRQMRSRVRVQVDTPETFYVGFEGDEPRLVADVANRLADLFVERTSVLRSELITRSDNFLDGEVDRLKRELDRQEEGLKGYRQSVAEVLPERLAANLKQIETLQQQIQIKTDQITETEARQAALRQEVQALEKQGGMEPRPPEKSESESALDDMKRKLALLRTKYRPEHPEVRLMEKEIRELQATKEPVRPARRDPTPVQLRYFSLQAELQSLEPVLRSYRGERESLKSQLLAHERKTNLTPRYETALSERARDVTVARTRYEALLSRQQEAKLSHRGEKTSSRPLFKVVEQAEVPKAPSGLSPRRVALLGLMASLGIGVLGIFLVDRLDTSFATTEELEAFTNIPVLASVPPVKPRKAVRGRGRKTAGDPNQADITDIEDRQMRKHGIVVPTDPTSIAAQQYSILAIRLRQWAERARGQIVMVTSGTGEEGKSLTSLNLSFALAKSTEERVLLIDCDLRLPQVHERLGLRPTKGFGDLLSTDDRDFWSYISTVGNLHVICGGLKPPNPVPLFASQRTRDVLSRIRREFKFIVLDAPPIVSLADSHVLAGVSDGVLLVVRSRKTRSELFQRAVESVDANSIAGVVLNDVEYADAPYAYAYRYYQRHYEGRS